MCLFIVSNDASSRSATLGESLTIRPICFISLPVLVEWLYFFVCHHVNQKSLQLWSAFSYPVLKCKKSLTFWNSLASCWSLWWQNIIAEEIGRIWRFTIDELHQEFPQVSRLVVYHNLTNKLHYKKLHVRWMPKMMTEKHKIKCMAYSLFFLEHYHKNGNEILSHRDWW